MVCDLTTPGPVQAIGLFAVDECFNPIYGPDAGYVDDCATVGSVEPQTEDTRAEFLKTCPNGDIRAFVPARTVTKTTDVTFNFAWLPIEWLVTVGAANPIMFNGEIVGMSDCDQAVNMIAVVWQELLGDDACGGGEVGASSVVTVYALRDVRFSEDGERGTSDFNYTVIGRAVRKNIGSGPIPLFFDSTAPEAAAWPDECIEVCAKGALFKAFAPPEECGIIDTTAPPVSCVPASAPAS